MNRLKLSKNVLLTLTPILLLLQPLLTFGQCDGGTVSSPSGDSILVCIDGMSDIVQFDSMGVVGPSYTYIITDEEDTIVGIPPGDMANFEPAGPGECHVYGFSYDGALNANTGMHISDISATQCGDLSSNFLVALRDTIDGGDILTINGEDTVYVCIDDSTDLYSFISSSQTSVENYQWIITNENDTIVGLPPSNMVDFNSAGPGICYVYGLAYLGDLNATVGMHIDSITAGECLDFSSNTIVALRDTIVGGIVETVSGEDTVYACIDDSADVYAFQSTSRTSSGNYQWVITDAEDTIIGLPPSNMANFNPAGPGICHVYGVAYLGDLNANTGMAVEDISADECISISDNFILVSRDFMDGGTLTTENSDDTAFVCIDGMPDIIQFNTTSSSNSMNYQYIVTDANDDILALPPSNMANFEPAEPGECHVYGLAYLGEIQASPGMNINNVTASECFELSSNYLVVIRDTMIGGSITTMEGEDSITIYVDGNPDIIQFSTTSMTLESNYQYVITNSKDTVLGLPPGNMADFDPAGLGECHVYGLAYLGEITGGPGNHISEIGGTECFQLSNSFLVVTRIDSTTSVSQPIINDGQIIAYPIPADDLINLEFESTAITQAELIISGLSGKQLIIENRTIIQGQNIWQVNLPEVLKGTFILTIRSSEQTINRLIIIQ